MRKALGCVLSVSLHSYRVELRAPWLVKSSVCTSSGCPSKIDQRGGRLTVTAAGGKPHKATDAIRRAKTGQNVDEMKRYNIKGTHMPEKRFDMVDRKAG